MIKGIVCIRLLDEKVLRMISNSFIVDIDIEVDGIFIRERDEIFGGVFDRFRWFLEGYSMV